MKPLLIAASVLLLCTTVSADNILVEAESFENPGGWVIDQQSMDQMGSPYLLAHGLGAPVKPATTTIAIAKEGVYRVFVRTRDWVAPFGAGEFRLAIDGKALPAAFGTKCGAKWTWQDGGTVNLAAGKVALSLEDRTGFEGRCDAIVLTDDKSFAPPNELKALAAFRRKSLNLPDTPPDAGKFDFVVVGGGIAGTCAAVSASRQGLSVALIQDRSVLGGNASSEIRVHPEGKVQGNVYPRLPDIVNEVSAGFNGGNTSPNSAQGDVIRSKLIAAEPNIKLFLNDHAYHVEKRGNTIAAIWAKDIVTSRELRFPGRLFADCTGDATIGSLAGAECRMGREGKDLTGESLAPAKGDRMTMGTSNMWYAKKTDEPSTFPECPWGLQFSLENCYKITTGNWDWESGMNMDTIEDAETIRDLNFRAIYGNWAFLKNNLKEYENYKLDWLAYMGGKRESRRIMGDVVLAQQDLEQKKQFPDGCVTTGWSIDLHYPTAKTTKDFPDQQFRSTVGKSVKVDPFNVPYRCFYSKDISNLVMAGRNISVTHVVLGTVRVQKTTGMMGVVIGRAAALCKQHDTTPRGVYEKHLEELKKLLDAPGKGAATRP